VIHKETIFKKKLYISVTKSMLLILWYGYKVLLRDGLNQSHLAYRIGSSGGFCEHSNVPFGSIKGGEVLD
jgi:hypothetical protein